MINDDNWTHTEYRSANYRAKISIGGEQTQDNVFAELFYVLKLAGDELITEQVFRNISQALSHLNTHYGHWKLTNLLTTEKSSCSSCQAH